MDKAQAGDCGFEISNLSTPILTVEAFSAIQTFTKQMQYYHKI